MALAAIIGVCLSSTNPGLPPANPNKAAQRYGVAIGGGGRYGVNRWRRATWLHLSLAAYNKQSATVAAASRAAAGNKARWRSGQAAAGNPGIAEAARR